MDILVTGATGNVGRAVLTALAGQGHRLFAGVRDPAHADLAEGVTPVHVDLAEGTGPQQAFDAIFLMRPPQIADPAPFRRFLEAQRRATRIVFLSVQGAERRGYLPHAKIEAVIRDMGFAHCFVRPAYFMENLLTTLAPELKRAGRVYLPAGRLALDWVSARDIAQVIAAALTGATDRASVTVASGRRLGFTEALAAVNRAAGTGFRYQPASLPGYLRHARARGMGWGMIGVMLLLHFLPRFSRPETASGEAEAVLGRPLETIEDWAGRNAGALRALAGADARA
ncbi:NmrA family NAD(P)-binding protein [Sinisalibacter lacisalsi]|uniref:NAD(P)-dependent oxidoreductase n=1 Tax=Sinisalibacter lacisalsi TaxID=1526570 RepID=A0ABQ1QTM5_9RHOB|nr:NmrA family NAD(P)-binding protein [Sinisalibacter lacisalsi]GGD42448.1 NAD(P)-dependent oxidoreductase [Sinisalibacter lacisalsi]